MSDIISIQTPMVPANFKSARHQQKLLYQNFLLDLAGNEYSNQNEKIILVKKFGDFVDRNLDGLNRLALSGNSDKLTHHLRNLEPLESKVTDSLRRNYQEIPELDDQIADVLANWPETDSSSTEWGWTSLITPVGKAYQTLKTLPEGHRLHQGYFMKELQSEELIIDYSHALVSTDSEEQKLMRLNNFINLYRNSTPKVLGEAVLTVRKVHTQLLDSDNIVLPKGSNDTIEKANKLLLRAQIANSIKYGTKNN